MEVGVAVELGISSGVRGVPATGGSKEPKAWTFALRLQQEEIGALRRRSGYWCGGSWDLQLR
ncbi:hypothetical protein IEQ34_004407 [Dendrobium chrysotoxum]|uniref:Uncharacterized protein n=1 Tax=Dendrobium chrysotoxum TaxID=161865 RepID=A0AAV7HGG6_DENCH|nr:hypothetical protein IEQ34_004407 [Dendrobium chrysotoxum]